MRFSHSIFASLLKPLDRRRVQAIAERHKGEAYVKKFHTWDHLLALVFAQLSGASSTRALESAWNANANHHYHLGTGELARSTLQDANRSRPAAVFAEIFTGLSGLADRTFRQEGKEVIRLIDSSPIPLGKMAKFATWNGRIRGMKMHTVYDPIQDRPTRVEVSLATVNDSEIGRKTPIEAGATYVFDKGYCHYGWWTQMHDADAWFVTRPKSNVTFRLIETRPLVEGRGEGFTVLRDCEVAFASKGDSKLAMPLRRIDIQRDEGGRLAVITNDMTRSAVEIAALYKARWQIELLFRWIKQHLKIRKFLGDNENAVKLQTIAAMIAYLLLRLAAKANSIKLTPIRFAELVQAAIFQRKPLAGIDRPAPVNPSKRQAPCLGQGAFQFADA
ncbi:MAG: IS4 family transposase [Alphaproteobacteria bacterium]|nr:IS4 family transposase [Alphaproteobacteria bacterium]